MATGTVGITETLIASAGFRNPALAHYHLRSGSAAIDARVDTDIGFDLGYDEYVIWKLFLPLTARQ